MKAFLLVIAVMVLAGCSPPSVPDITYYRLPRHEPLPASAPLFGEPLVVDTFNADGLYADQALIYALDSDAHELRQFHYQLWTDPPTRMLQRRLIILLREAKVAPLVTDELPASRPAIRISGVILRMDRVPKEGGFSAAVSLKLRADGVDGSPIVDEIYRREVPAQTTGLETTVTAMGQALDAAFADFYADLVAKGGGHG